MTAFVALMGMKGVGEDLERVLRLAKHPVGNFGRLAQFARSQWNDVVVGHSFDRPAPAAQGRRPGPRAAHEAAGQARSCACSGTHREEILDLELIHQRVAGAVIDLYAMAAVISKLQSQLPSEPHTRQ